jgi:hypothetical protein
VTYPIVAWYAERGILVSVDAMRPPEQVGREILAALEVMRPLVDHDFRIASPHGAHSNTPDQRAKRLTRLAAL